jgi:hypothetical protein
MALKDNLISVWELDEASGNALDSHGTNTLTETSGTIASAAGKCGNARDFEAGDTEYFEIADNDSLSTGNIDFTVSAWVYGESLASFPVIAHKGWRATGSTDKEWVIWYNAGDKRFMFETCVSSATIRSAYGHNFGEASTATWYHIVAWHDSVNDQIGLSINAGTPNTSTNNVGVNAGAGNLQIGAASVQSLYWDGLIDQVAFWKRVLTSDERTALYNSGNGLAYSAWDAGGIPILMHHYRRRRI